jgi:anti-sigma28 factor (negative regulator of flagellin synthesis)
MVALTGIQTLGGNAPLSVKRTEDTANREPQAVAEDHLDLSPESMQAALLAKLTADLADSEVRREKVEEAKRQIQEGAYRVVNIVNVVASRISGVVAA